MQTASQNESTLNSFSISKFKKLFKFLICTYTLDSIEKINKPVRIICNKTDKKEAINLILQKKSSLPQNKKKSSKYIKESTRAWPITTIKMWSILDYCVFTNYEYAINKIIKAIVICNDFN